MKPQNCYQCAHKQSQPYKRARACMCVCALVRKKESTDETQIPYQCTHK